MKVILKFPLYVVADFDKNIDRAVATREIQKLLWPHLNEYLEENPSFRRSVVRDLEESSGSPVSVKVVTERQLFTKLEK